MFGNRGLDSYYAACFLARCVPLAREAAVKQGYTARVVEQLREAAARGVLREQRLPDLEKTKFAPLGPEVAGALAELDARTRSPMPASGQ